MYTRFALARAPVAEYRAAPGLFHYWRLLPPYDPGDWRHREICRTYDWFCDHLERPGVLTARMGRHGRRHGLCWFRPDAAEHVSQARYLAWLLGEIGIPVAQLRSPAPGTRIFEDAHQIVVVPSPRAIVTLH